jgi:hypothetical protein
LIAAAASFGEANSEFMRHSESAEAAGTLRRLVCFAASALDVRLAFVIALPPEGGGPGPRCAVWLAKDYGLRSCFAELDLPEGIGAPGEVARILVSAFPSESSLAGIGDASSVVLPLWDPRNRPLGYLGVAGPGRNNAWSCPEHLRPLVRPAANEVARFVSRG